MPRRIRRAAPRGRGGAGKGADAAVDDVLQAARAARLLLLLLSVLAVAARERRRRAREVHVVEAAAAVAAVATTSRAVVHARLQRGAVVAPDAAPQVRRLLLERADAGAQARALLVLQLREAFGVVASGVERLALRGFGVEAGVVGVEGGDAGAEVLGFALGVAELGLGARVRLAVQRRERLGLFLERFGALARVVGGALGGGERGLELRDAGFGRGARVAFLLGGGGGTVEVGGEVGELLGGGGGGLFGFGELGGEGVDGGGLGGGGGGGLGELRVEVGDVELEGLDGGGFGGELGGEVVVGG